VAVRNVNSSVLKILQKREVALWLSNGVQCGLVAMNTLSWGYLIKARGDLQLTVPFITSFFLNPFFWTAMLTGFISVILSYYAIAKIGLAKSVFFYHTGAIVVILTAYFGVGETFSLTQILAIVLILTGSVLVSRKGEGEIKK
jgi:drug/metabolite transporter (DMT)-like permease